MGNKPDNNLLENSNIAGGGQAELLANMVHLIATDTKFQSLRGRIRIMPFDTMAPDQTNECMQAGLDRIGAFTTCQSKQPCFIMDSIYW